MAPSAPLATPMSSITIYIGERELACFVCLYHHSRSHFTKFIGGTRGG